MLTGKEIAAYKNRLQRKRYYEKCKKKGICIECAAPTEINPKTKEHFTRCEKCRAKAAAYWQRKRAKNN